MGEQILGRTAIGDITVPATGEVLVRDGEMVVEADVYAIDNSKIDEVVIRSVLTCEPATASVPNVTAVTLRAVKR